MKPYQEQNYYELLEVTPSASMAEIRSAYERAVEVYGEDSVALYALENPAVATELRDKMREAMEILTDEDLRGEYDRMIGLPPYVRAESPPPSGIAAAEVLVTAEGLHSTHPELKVAYGPPTSPPPAAPKEASDVSVTATAPAPPARSPPQRSSRNTTRDVDASPGIAETEAIASAEAAMAQVAARTRELAKAKSVEITPDAEFSGELLRRIRESKGLSLQQISDRTRIATKHLENIEADRYTSLPAAVYLRGILSNLARELGLDQARVSKSYLSLAAGKKP